MRAQNLDNDTDKNSSRKLTVTEFMLMKNREKISMVTSYDYWSSKICDKAGIDVLLVGDSAGMVMLGYDSTIPVRMKEMLLFTRAVARGTKRGLIVSDMPLGSYQTDTMHAIRNAIRFIKAGSDAVKLEGGVEVADKIKAIVNCGIPVLGHIGLKPQTAKLWEGYKVQGNTCTSGSDLIKDAKELEKAGVFGIVLEMVASEISKLISKNVRIPTIGIGSGPYCDGQVLVLHDMLGLYDDIKPRFVKNYTHLSKHIFEATQNYINEVKTGVFPEDKHTFHMKKDEYNKLKAGK
ncbi:MAG TPA: 3-methyl-2-oxobutanoate hydroxymethyltransferase [Nitrososphaeraceae archaeon]|nr:3-methyl-2-oxobutanoate hydroxymethyltransferase [Nitrososphaeraceae archaeon]